MITDFLWVEIVQSVAKLDAVFRNRRAMSENGKVSIDSSSIVCAEAVIEGEVTMKEGCVVHPHVVIDASKGPIFIGQNNLFEEFAVIRNNSDGQPMIIGDSNVFRVHSKCHAKYVGSRNVVGVLAELSDGCSISDDCHVSPRCQVHSHQNLEPSVTVYGAHNEHRTTATPNLKPTHELEILRKILPSYHHLYGAKKKAAQ